MLALCHHGLVPAWCRAKLKIAAEQQLQHTGPYDLSFTFLNKVRLEGRRPLQGKKEWNTLSWLVLPTLRFLAFFPTTPSCSSLSPLHSPMVKKERERGRARRAGGNEGMKQNEWANKHWSSEASCFRRLPHLPPSSLTWFHHHHNAATGHFSPHPFHNLEKCKTRWQVATGERWKEKRIRRWHQEYKILRAKKEAWRLLNEVLKTLGKHTRKTLTRMQQINRFLVAEF